jgi:hypothetical protein
MITKQQASDWLKIYESSQMHESDCYQGKDLYNHCLAMQEWRGLSQNQLAAALQTIIAMQDTLDRYQPVIDAAKGLRWADNTPARISTIACARELVELFEALGELALSEKGEGE